ncbi:epoxide hydrolase, soluble (sEH) [Nowakowskiella sp. JEL0407]|nr:epoxide hydrolase, soluble (sEH) [Nowakowskiella sp. JEL0407]
MESFVAFNTKHQDLILDVAYNFYGNRLATCSADHKIKIWDSKSEPSSPDPSWSLSCSWKAHDASILKVTWGHPEFGQFIASCSLDRTVKIWEEPNQKNSNQWTLLQVISSDLFYVQDIQFTPSHLGLKLALVSSHGILRIYESTNVVNLSKWILVDEFEIFYTNSASSGSQKIHCLAWNPDRGQEAIAVGCGSVAKVYRKDVVGKWKECEVLSEGIDGASMMGSSGSLSRNVGGLVTDVAWANGMGRSYQLIATSNKNGFVRIYKLFDSSDSKPIAQPIQSSKTKIGSLKRQKKVELVAEFNEHNSEVWRVEWNVTGTILSSCGDDGSVRLWKASYLDGWKSMGVLKAESPPS